ncbi:MAG: SUMF1/EgtB/PvdO family nonheme iron enzyme [Acidobacteria bacterium]|nr:SUMF1/EgtB/PvdO family nonheme iron enzyme [Acidobacteriota bacterium]
MSPSLRNRFNQFLLDVPQWHREDERWALVDILRDYEVYKDLDLSGSAAVAAARFLDLADKHGSRPFLIFLSGLRQMETKEERLREIAAIEAALRNRPREPWDGPPYRGLDFFDREHAPIFFGREAEVDALLHTLAATDQGRRFTVVLGASGSGKSSLVRAGVWARLASGQVPEFPGSEHWLITPVIPGEMGTPEDSLRAALSNAIRGREGWRELRGVIESAGRTPLADLAERLLRPGEARWLLILDQMEELFAADRKEAGAAFLDRLLEATLARAGGKPSRFQVLATLRADFSQYCIDHPLLKRAVGREGGTFWLGPPDRLSLERMVSGPVTEVELAKRWTLDPALPPAIAADAVGRPGGLALMAFTLRELFELCEGDCRLDLATYRGPAIGGLGGAISRKADQTLAELGPDGGATLERVFRRLVQVSRDDAATRRRERRSAWAEDSLEGKLVDAFVEARLLVADRGGASGGDPVIEVAHEALLREWPRLAGWIEQSREAFHLADRVRTEARLWNGADRQRGWEAYYIDHARKRLEQAGLLAQLIEDPHVRRFLTPEVEWIIEELRCEGTTHERRREIGQRLAHIGDLRPGIGVKDGVPEILWWPIPGGEVEIEEHDRFVVEPFHMAAYPVTIGQFRAFLDAKDGYRKKRWWKDLQRQDPDSAWQSPLVNHPVTDVSWYDATAFCRWLTVKKRYEVRLPDEQEWQWAAQSARPDFRYPWGPEWRDGVANTSESDIHRTTAVGMYPGGASQPPQQVADLAGNVWEWCRNEYADPRKTGPGGGESRVLRGGSWDDGQGRARADARYFFHPGYRLYYIGFRVVCSSPIADH